MTLAELHPDELLMREASSTLTPTEWADLSAHLERCPACALERAARREAARVRVPSDLDHAIAARVVGRLLAGPAGPAEPDREIAPAKRGGRVWGRRLAYAAVALVLVSGTAMAGAALVVQIRQRQAARVESESRQAPPVQPAAKPVPRPVEPVRPPAETAPPSPTVGVAVRREAGGGRPVAVNRRLSSLGRAEGARADAATLLHQAQEAESAGRLAGASQLYGELGRSFPGTREELVARALHGQLLLDKMGNPVRALALFEAYLNAEPTGTLAEEARLGRARSLERLGRSTEERSAWLDLLRAHPRSVHAVAARSRLATLDAP